MIQTKQNSTKKSSYFFLTIFLIFSCSGLVSVYLLNTDFGSISVSTVVIPSEKNKLTGWLYRPVGLSDSDSLPTVILAHGFSGSKYSMSGLAIEVARRGFVSLALDLVGHGNSDPVNESTLGILAAITYLGSLPYANLSRLGIVGHSMGAGAAHTTALKFQNITATVLIGSVGLVTNGTILNDFNSTFPENLLVAIGEYDEFYSDISRLNTLLMPIFGSTSPVIPNHAFYGSFTSRDARRLVVSKTNHILEPVDPHIISETIDWLQNSLKSISVTDEHYLAPSNIIYTYREVVSLVTLISIISLVFPLIFIIYETPNFSKEKDFPRSKVSSINLIKPGLVWGIMIILFFIPLSLIGAFIPFPPIRFGPSIGLWFLVVNLCTISLLILFPRFFGLEDNLKSVFKNGELQWKLKNGILLACGIIIILYLFMFLLGLFFSIQLGFVIGVLGNFLLIPRILGFFVLLPLFVIFFLIDGFLFHFLIIPVTDELNWQEEIFTLSKILLTKASPFLLPTVLVYTLKILLGVHILPTGMFALLFQFYWVIGAFLVIGNVITYLWY
ncbi:MAG: alpha/beta hydrolase, partial [Candidatus Hodarchaeales archaeon]